MASYIEVDGSMLDEVYELVRLFNNPEATKERWKLALDPPWYTGKYPSGLAVRQNGRLVGFVGTLFVEREVEGRLAKICNVHSLITAPGEKVSIARLLVRLIKMKEWTYVVYTPTREVRDFLPGAGLISMHDQVQVLPTLGSASRSGSQGRGVEIIHEHGELKGLLTPEENGMINDHLGGPCRHLVVTDGQRSCHVTYLISSEPANHAVVLRVGDSDLFQAAQRALRADLKNRYGVRAVLLDSRLVGGNQLDGGYMVPFDARRFCRPGLDCPPPRSIDNLYSEFAMLGVPTFPSLVDEARQVAAPFLGRARRRAISWSGLSADQEQSNA